jgi:lysophospholipase L1-like esterase
MRHTLSVAFLLSAITFLPAAEPNKDFFFKKGDRVVFLGDSITEQYQYSSYIELYLTTRFPAWNMQFLNAGIGGDTANGGARRFAEQVLDEKPTAVTIDFGMNDGGYGAFNAVAAEKFARQTSEMVDMAKKAEVRVALISPNAVDVRPRPNLKTYLETQQQFYAPLKEIADKEGVAFVDQYAVTRKVLEKIAADNAAVKPFPDGVHTSPAGGLLMARTILVGLKAPALVSNATIDAATKEATGSHCSVADVAGGPDGISFKRTDEALPLPVIKGWRDILPYVDDLNDLNRYGLKVTGLKAGKYNLLIDDNAVASYTGDQLAAGVNLGNLDAGPLFEQGEAVLKAINEKNQIVHKRFRGVILAQIPDWLADVAEVRKPIELKKRKEQIEAKQAEVYELARPKQHTFELKAEN